MVIDFLRRDNMILISILEVLAVVAVIIGFIHEDKVIAFEERISEKIRK